MSVTLPMVDLSSAVVGTSGTIPLQASGLVSVPSQDPPHLQLYNDSGAGLLITLNKSSQQFYLGAKGHCTIAISNSESEIDYSVKNVATNIQVNQLWAVYYYPGEEVSDFVPLGTSTVSQQATTLLNTGNPVGTNIIFAEPLGDSTPSGAINITNSGLIEAGDTVNSGKIVVSGTHVSLAATNNIFPDEITILGTSNQEVDLLVSGVDATITLKNQAGTSVLVIQTSSPAVDLSAINSAVSLLLNSAPIKSKSGTNLSLDTNAGTDAILLKNNGTIEAQVDNTGLALKAGTISLLTGSIARVSKFTGTATTTATLFNHGLGAVPDIVLLQLVINSTTAHGVYYFNDASLTSTQVKIISDGTNAFVGLAIKF